MPDRSSPVRLAAALLALSPVSADAQNAASPAIDLPATTVAPAPTPTPSPSRTPRPLLPPPQVVPEPELGPIGLGLPVTGTRRPTPAPTGTQPAPKPVGEPDPAPSSPLPITPVPAPPASAAPIAIDPDPVATDPATPAASSPDFSWWMIPAVGAGVVLLAGLALLLRRRRSGQKRQDESVIIVPPPPPLPPPEPLPPAAAAAPVPQPPAPRPAVTPPVLRPWIEVDFVPRRAGTNLTGASVDFELAVRNIGSEPASDVRVLVQLITANAQQNAQLAAAFGTSGDNPVLVPFAIQPGETATIKAVGSLPLEKVSRIDLEGRPMFVPIMAVRALYRWGAGQQGSTANAYILGIDRGEGDKMQPFWLDIGPRMFDRITYRLHETGIRL